MENEPVVSLSDWRNPENTGRLHVQVNVWGDVTFLPGVASSSSPHTWLIDGVAVSPHHAPDRMRIGAIRGVSACDVELVTSPPCSAGSVSSAPSAISPMSPQPAATSAVKSPEAHR